MLSKRMISQFKVKLETEQQKLLKNIKKLKKVDKTGTSVDDNADEAEVLSENIDIGNDFSRLLDEIEEALGRIKDNTYGTCARCGNEIAPERLKAYPAALFCINCESKQTRRWWQIFHKKTEEK